MEEKAHQAEKNPVLNHGHFTNERSKQAKQSSLPGLYFAYVCVQPDLKIAATPDKSKEGRARAEWQVSKCHIHPFINRSLLSPNIGGDNGGMTSKQRLWLSPSCPLSPPLSSM
ncbi:hypothetical protein H8959_016701 [Pygathrix nigripes]